MALRIYRSPEGLTFQYEEGTQPDGYVLVRTKAAPKRKTAANKAKQADNK